MAYAMKPAGKARFSCGGLGGGHAWWRGTNKTVELFNLLPSFLRTRSTIDSVT